MTVFTNPEHQNRAEDLRRQVRSLAAQKTTSTGWPGCLGTSSRSGVPRQWNGSIPGRTALWPRTEISATASTR
jgi:hypothetical protein